MQYEHHSGKINEHQISQRIVEEDESEVDQHIASSNAVMTSASGHPKLDNQYRSRSEKRDFISDESADEIRETDEEANPVVLIGLKDMARQSCESESKSDVG